MERGGFGGYNGALKKRLRVGVIRVDGECANEKGRM